MRKSAARREGPEPAGLPGNEKAALDEQVSPGRGRLPGKELGELAFSAGGSCEGGREFEDPPASPKVGQPAEAAPKEAKRASPNTSHNDPTLRAGMR